MIKQYIAADIDPTVEVWQVNEIETWVGHGLEEIKNHIVNVLGVPEDEAIDDPKKVPRDRWDKSYIVDIEADYLPRYTYSNMIVKDMVSNVEMPYLLCGTEC
jgi:hypothetical protein